MTMNMTIMTMTMNMTMTMIEQPLNNRMSVQSDSVTKKFKDFWGEGGVGKRGYLSQRKVLCGFPLCLSDRPGQPNAAMPTHLSGKKMRISLATEQSFNSVDPQ